PTSYAEFGDPGFECSRRIRVRAPRRFGVADRSGLAHRRGSSIRLYDDGRRSGPAELGKRIDSAVRALAPSVLAVLGRGLVAASPCTRPPVRRFDPDRSRDARRHTRIRTRHQPPRRPRCGEAPMPDWPVDDRAGHDRTIDTVAILVRSRLRADRFRTP